MIGAIVLAKISALREVGVTDEDEVASTLIAAVLAESIRRGEGPRTVLDSLWKSLPTDREWWDGEAAERISALCDELTF